MKAKRSVIIPSNTKIIVWELDPLIVGGSAIVLPELISITKLLLKKTKVVIGYTTRTWAQPRFKHYENHGGLDVAHILLIYRTDNIGDATDIEANLINRFKGKHPNNCNVRNEQRREEDSKDRIYYVYLAIERFVVNENSSNQTNPFVDL